MTVKPPDQSEVTDVDVSRAHWALALIVYVPGENHVLDELVEDDQSE